MESIRSRASLFNLRVIPDFENLPPMTKSKALKVFQKMVLATIAGNLMLGRKGYMKK